MGREKKDDNKVPLHKSSGAGRISCACKGVHSSGGRGGKLDVARLGTWERYSTVACGLRAVTSLRAQPKQFDRFLWWHVLCYKEQSASAPSKFLD